MDNEKLLELMTKMYSDMQEGFKKVDKRFDALEVRVDRVEKTVLKIEHDHGEKLQALFDGYKQYTNQLNLIEKEVSKHDEFILKRL